MKEKKKPGLANCSEEVRKRVASSGGKATAKKQGHMSEIGKKGGAAVARKEGHMREIGSRGGEKTRLLYEKRRHAKEYGTA